MRRCMDLAAWAVGLVACGPTRGTTSAGSTGDSTTTPTSPRSNASRSSSDLGGAACEDNGPCPL